MDFEQFHGDNPYNPQTNSYSLFHRLQHTSINNDPTAVDGSLWNPSPDLLYDPFDVMAMDQEHYYSVNVHTRVLTDEDHYLIETPFDLQHVDNYNNIREEGFEMISSSNIHASHDKKKNMSKRKRVVDSNMIIKGQWTSEEDVLLVEFVEKYGVGKWSSIAQMLPGRIGKQCRERWHNHLKPNIKKDRWTEEEDQILIEAHKKLGNKWSKMTLILPGRSENTIKNHWNATKRRQLSSSRKNGRNSKSSNTPLQNYIRSLMETGGVGGCFENSLSFGSMDYSSDNNQGKWLKGNEMNDEIVDEESWGMLASCSSFMESQNDLQNQMGFMKMFWQ